MKAVLFPICSEYETEDPEAGCDCWLRAKVQASRDDARPSVSNDDAMARTA